MLGLDSDFAMAFDEMNNMYAGTTQIFFYGGYISDKLSTYSFNDLAR